MNHFSDDLTADRREAVAARANAPNDRAAHPSGEGSR
jgi:hypothetical protein